MERNQEQQRRKNRILYGVMGLLAVVFILLLVGSMVLDSFASSIGVTKWVWELLARSALCGIALFFTLYCVVPLFRKKGISRKRVIGAVLGCAVCVGAAVLLLAPVLEDFSYLEDSSTAYLYRLDFDSDSIGDSPTRYYLSGVGIDGESYRFQVSRKKYQEGREENQEMDYDLQAKVTYLPHSKTVMSVEYGTELEAQARELFPASSELPNGWESFALEINQVVYTLPAPLSDFLENGWSIAEEDAGIQLEGADEPYEEYRSAAITLVSQQGQSLDVTVYNTTEEPLDVSQGTVGFLYAIYGNYDFSGEQLRLPGGLMLGWSTEQDVLDLYGEPHEVINDHCFVYQEEGNLTSYWRLSFTDTGYLEDVMVRNLPFFREK